MRYKIENIVNKYVLQHVASRTFYFIAICYAFNDNLLESSCLYSMQEFWMNLFRNDFFRHIRGDKCYITEVLAKNS